MIETITQNRESSIDCPQGDGFGSTEQTSVSCLEEHRKYTANAPEPSDHAGSRVLGISLQDSQDQKLGRVEIQGKAPINMRKQSLKIATMNIRGKMYGDSRKSKYKDVSTLMRKERIAIMVLTESKLNEKEMETQMNMNPKLQFVTNCEESGKEGITCVFNKDLVQSVEWNHKCIIKNRVSRLDIKWNEQIFNLIGVYCPNEPKEKAIFITHLKQMLLKEDDMENLIMLGDFNAVENAIDRYPPHKEKGAVRDALKNLVNTLELEDGWRTQNPDTLAFTHQATNQSLSRIDRIYATRDIIMNSYEWDIINAAKISDHSIATVELARTNMPEHGKGLWRLPSDLLKDKIFNKKASEILMKAQKRICNYEQQVGREDRELKTLRQKCNPQKVLLQAKNDIKSAAEKRSRQMNKERNQKKNKLKTMIKNNLKQMQTETNNPTLRDNMLILRNELEDDDKQRLRLIQQAAKARFVKEGEKCTKYWFALGKSKKSRDSIKCLVNENLQPTTKTEEMCDIAAKYHAALQQAPEHTTEKIKATKRLLKPVKAMELSPEHKETLATYIKYEEVRQTIKKLPNGKAPGIDGLTYEFWKSFPEPREEDISRLPSVSGILTAVFNDIEEYGLENEEFNAGVMSLMYKKKDNRKIENYRPLTLLNTDYKIMTRCIATKLGKVCPDIINEDQAGFIPGRGLYDHTRLSRTIIDYCEVERIEGCIISLDQEKAYDKIDHKYLYKVLKAFGMPTAFIKTIKELYKNAKTTILINGTKAQPFDVNRGVRQGDPMSCLLYNLAIEPLAIALRNSELKGIPLPGNELVRIIVKLFADDTLIYMSKNDSLKLIRKIIKLFCTASTAVFNLEKTEYLPIGPERFRARVIRKRQIGKKSNKIPEGLKIVKDKEPMRTLGAWIGNGVEIQDKWNDIIKTQMKIIKVWRAMHPTFRGKELLAKALITSRAWFLATVNGMPKGIMTEMHQLIRNFLWDNRRNGYIPWKQAIAPRSEGGLNMPDIKSRLDAIELIWVKKWLAPEDKRPAWAYYTDAIIMKYLTREPKVEMKAKRSWIFQSWHESKSKDSKIPQYIRRLLQVARKYNVAPHALKVSHEVKSNMPMWHHFAITNNFRWNKKASKCLRNMHHVKTINDFETGTNAPRRPHVACNKIARAIITSIPDKWNPNVVTPHFDNLDFTDRRRKENAEKDVQSEAVTFDPNVTESKTIEETLRVFTNFKGKSRDKTKRSFDNKSPAYRLRVPPPRQNLIFYTDGSSLKNGSENSPTGIGIWHTDGSEYNKALKVSGGDGTNQRAEMIAIIIAVKQALQNDLTIISDSKTTLEGILKHVKTWEDDGYLNVQNSDLWQSLMAAIRMRGSVTQFQWVKGHNNNPGNEKADQQAGSGASKMTNDEIDLTIPDNWVLQGARLCTLKQKVAYGHIVKLIKEKPGGDKTHWIVEDIKDEVERITGKRPPATRIWKNIWHKNIPLKVSDFLWKLTHDKLRCGNYFRHIPSWEEKQMCVCGEIETPYHILLECQNRHPKVIWQRIKEIWNAIKEPEAPIFPTPSIGLIRGFGVIVMGDNKRMMKAWTRRYHVLMSHAIWLIWKLRCDSIFEERAILPNEYISRLNEKIRETLQVELTTIKQSMNKEKPVKAFERTWTTNNYLAVKVSKDWLIKI